MARKQDTKKRKTGLVGRIVRAAADFVLSPLLGEKKERGEKKKTRGQTATPREHAPEKVRRGPERVSRARVEPVESLDRHGAARDERSFEQRRRGGPMTGGAPESKAKGPRHAGGSKRRGRDARTMDVLAELKPLPIVDYDELSAEEIKERVGDLGRNDIIQLVRYEKANKHRKSIVSLLEKRLAA